MSVLPDFIAELRKRFTGDIRFDLGTRVLYSTDASIYQIEPLGIVLPRNVEDLQSAVEVAAKFKLPILPRGAGTSLAGQAIGQAVILDCSRWLDRIVTIDAEAQTATIGPGVVLSTLNAAAARHGLTFGPDPASAERATMGGVIGNNATGAHSILYGMTADHLISAEVVMADGRLASLGEMPAGADVIPPDDRSLASSLYRVALRIRRDYGPAIREHYPQTWRNSAGYRLNYLLPWSASRPPEWQAVQAAWDAGSGEAASPGYPPVGQGSINLAHLLAGSEGTLAIMHAIKVRLVRKPQYTALAVLAYPSLVEACDDVPRLLGHSPSAIELIPQMLIRLARSIPAYAGQLSWVSGDPAALLVVEFSGDDATGVAEKARSCGTTLRVATIGEEQSQIWAVRKAGLGLLDSAPTATRPVAFIEDCAIPVERSGEFVREVERILLENEVEAAFYAHASAGCLHIRPILDLRTGRGVRALRSLAEAVLALTIRLGGAMSSEHGDGLARSEWLEQIYGEQVVEAMALLKHAADPQGLLNPGKIVEGPPMDTQLRFGASYRSRAWPASLDFSRAGGLEMAIEQCNGQGTCRKEAGVMCPSYQATRDEMYSTRGRANLLRTLISSASASGGSLFQTTSAELLEATRQALDLCLACKGCKAECPSGVDMAKIKFAFEHEYYKAHRRALSDYLFGYFHLVAKLSAAVAPLANFVLGSSILRRAIAAGTGVTGERPMPRFARSRARPRRFAGEGRGDVIFLSDAFTRYIEPQVEQAAFDVLAAMGFQVRFLPCIGAGAALLSKGFISAARKHAGSVLMQLREMDPEGRSPLVGLEPPEIYCLKNDYPDLVPERREEAVARASRAWLLDEFMLRCDGIGKVASPRNGAARHSRVKFHPHCHQRAEAPAEDGLPTGSAATMELLRRCGYEVDLIDAGCCGMAGTFGYEERHYKLSQKIAELKLFPAIRAAIATGKRGAGPDVQIASSGSACRLQITQGTGAAVSHPIELVAKSIIAAE